MTYLDLSYAWCSRISLTFAASMVVACGPSSSSPPGQGGTDGGEAPTNDESSDGAGADESSSGEVFEPDDWGDLLEPVAGSRLRPVFRVADDGTRIPNGWHDTLLDTRCEFRYTDDAGLRCLTDTYGATEIWHYADPDCTEPAMQTGAIPDGASVVRVRGNSCFDQTYYQLLEPVEAIYYTANGPCEFFSNDEAVRVALVSNTDFVGATVTPLEGNDRVVPMLLVADDGAQQIFGAWDTVHEEEVRPSADASGQRRWFSRHQPRLSELYFTDSTCSEPVALAQCVHPSEVVGTAREEEGGTDFCQDVVGRHEVVEEIETVYRMSDSGCVEASLSGSIRTWTVGAPLDDEAFAIAPVENEGGTRLRHEIYAGPSGGRLMASGRTFDTLLDDMACDWRDSISPEDPEAEVFDCAPINPAHLRNRYLDASCTEQVARHYVFEESCESTPLYAWAAGVVATIASSIASEGGYELDEEEDCVEVEPLPGGGSGGEEDFYVIDDEAVFDAVQATDIVE
ncbi:MAG: hypothetical protein AAF799_32650 [Myxococcota bacterium]